jgi:hypothetical protein
MESLKIVRAPHSSGKGNIRRKDYARHCKNESKVDSLSHIAPILFSVREISMRIAVAYQWLVWITGRDGFQHHFTLAPDGNFTICTGYEWLWLKFERELASNQQKRARGLVQTRMLACALDVGHDKIVETSCGRIDPVVRPLNHPYQETRLFYIVKTPRSRPVRNDLSGCVSGQMASVSPAGCFSHLAWRLGSSHGRSSKTPDCVDLPNQETR